MTFCCILKKKLFQAFRREHHRLESFTFFENARTHSQNFLFLLSKLSIKQLVMSRFIFFSAVGIALFFLTEGVLSTPANVCSSSTCTAFVASADLSNGGCANQATGTGSILGHFDMIDDSVFGNIDVVWSAPDNKLTLSVTAAPPSDDVCFEDIRYAAFLPLMGRCDLEAIPDEQEVYYASFGSWCSGETNVFEVKLDPATTPSSPALCVAVWTNVVDPVCKESEECVGPDPFECLKPSSPMGKGKGKSKSKGKSKGKGKGEGKGEDICKVRESKKSCDDAETSWCATSFIKLERFCLIDTIPFLTNSTGANARWKRFDNLNSDTDRFYIGRGNLGSGSCRVNPALDVYVYNDLNELEMTYDADDNTWKAKIIPGSNTEVTQTVDFDDPVNGLQGCSTAFVKNWNALKIQIQNSPVPGGGTGVVRLTDVKFNDVAIGDFCFAPGTGSTDFYFNLGGYNLFGTGAITTVTGNLILCGAAGNFDSNEADRVQIGFVKTN
jgi:hypothetical protein